MRLGDFILKNLEPILQQWEDFAKTIEQSRDVSSATLRDHAEKVLRTVAADLATVQTPDERIIKSHGNTLEDHDETAAETHAITRLMAGFTINQMVSEYRVLRMSVLMKWLQRIKSGTDFEVEDMMRFNEAVDQALAESIASYSHAIEEARSHFLGLLGHDLRTHLGAILLSADVLLHTEDLGAGSAKVASRIYTSVKRADQVVGDLLDVTYSRLGSRVAINS